MKKSLVVTASIVAVLALTLTTGVAYAGFVPGVSDILKVNKPVDLGVRYDSADVESFKDDSKFGTIIEYFGEEEGKLEGTKLVVYGARTNKAVFTQEEITAFLNSVPWSGAPLRNSQVRLSEGAIEYSGNVDAKYVSDLIQSVYPSDDYGSLGPVLKLAGRLHNPAVYLKMGIGIDNEEQGPSGGQLRIKVLALKVNTFDLSADIEKMSEITAKVGEGNWTQGTPYSLGSLAISSGQLDVYGTLPTNFAVGDGDPSSLCDGYSGGALLSLDPIDGRIGTALKYCD